MKKFQKDGRLQKLKRGMTGREESRKERNKRSRGMRYEEERKKELLTMNYVRRK